MSSTTINERFQKIIDELYNGSQRAFSMAIDVTPSTINGIVGTRKSSPSFDVLQKTTYAIANINLF